MFDIFFVDSEGIDDMTSPRDTYESNPDRERQRKLISILMSISSFVIYNGQGLDLERDLERMSCADEPPCELRAHLLWLIRDCDRTQEQMTAQAFIQSLFAGELKTNPACEMHADTIKQLYSEKYGFKLTKPANDQEIIEVLEDNDADISPDFVE